MLIRYTLNEYPPGEPCRNRTYSSAFGVPIATTALRFRPVALTTELQEKVLHKLLTGFEPVTTGFGGF